MTTGEDKVPSEMDIHNLEDTGLTQAEHEDMHAAWQVNTAAVGERVLAKGGFAVPYFTAMQRFGNMSDRDSIQAHCNRDMATVCKVNQSTGKPNIHGQAMLHEFTRYPLSLWSSNGTLPYFDQVSGGGGGGGGVAHARRRQLTRPGARARAAGSNRARAL